MISGVSDLIAEAFADDDLVEQFEEEKRRVENREQEEEMSPALPGWGSWTGPDVKGDRRKNKRY